MNYLLEVKLYIYFVTSVFNFILNIVSSKLKHKNENRWNDFDAFDHQEISIFIFWDFYSLILADNIVIYL